MKFKSKIDWWYLVCAIMLLMNIWCVVLFVQERDVLVLIVTLVFVFINILGIIPMWTNTYYVLDENGLLVKCGLGKGLKIPYGSLKSAEETRNPFSSSALSLDRIEIRFGTGDIVLISPKNKQDFLQQLKVKMACLR